MQAIVAAAVALIINLIVLLFFQKRYESRLYRVVALTYIGTITLRYALAIYLWLNHTDPGFARTFWGDSQTYDILGAAVADGWWQGSELDSWKHTIEGGTNRGFIYFVASVYFVAGRNVLLVQFLNGIIGALTPICIMEIGLSLYGQRVATRAMLITAFFPQIIFWSSGLYKDPMVMLCIAANILSTVRMKQNIRPVHLFFYLTSAVALLFLRFYLFYIIIATTLTTFLVGQRRGIIFGLLSQTALVATVVLLLLFTPVGQEALVQQRHFNFEQLQRSRTDLSRATSGFVTDADVSTPTAALRVLPVGVVYLLFSPFPWTVSSLRQVLALPDILMWYLMIPFLIKGLASTIRHRLGQTMPVLVFTMALTLAYGVFQGNAGAAYRQRTQIMMFFFLFVAEGMVGGRQREEEEPETGSSELAVIPRRV